MPSGTGSCASSGRRGRQIAAVAIADAEDAAIARCERAQAIPLQFEDVLRRVERAGALDAGASGRARGRARSPSATSMRRGRLAARRVAYGHSPSISSGTCVRTPCGAFPSSPSRFLWTSDSCPPRAPRAAVFSPFLAFSTYALRADMRSTTVVSASGSAASMTSRFSTFASTSSSDGLLVLVLVLLRARTRGHHPDEVLGHLQLGRTDGLRVLDTRGPRSSGSRPASGVCSGRARRRSRRPKRVARGRAARTSRSRRGLVFSSVFLRSAYGFSADFSGSR